MWNHLPDLTVVHSINKIYFTSIVAAKSKQQNSVENSTMQVLPKVPFTKQLQGLHSGGE